MVVMSVRSHLFQLWWRTASVRRLATGRLELDRRVIDVKAVTQTAVQLVEDARTFGGWHLVHRDMAGQGLRLRPQAPDMQVVHV